MSNAQQPVVKLGTKLSSGVVTRIGYNKVEVLGEDGVRSLTFTQVEKEIL